MAIVNYIFDLDGTLANTLPVCVKAFRKALEPILNQTISDNDILATFGPSEEGTINTFAPHCFDKAMTAYMHHYRLEHQKCAEPFSGIRDVLDMLKNKKCFMALVTGKGEKCVDITLDTLRIRDYFHAVECGSPEGCIKERQVTAMLEEFNLNRDETVYVGDSDYDVHEAHKCSIQAIGAAWADTASAEKLKASNPEYLFTKVSELQDFIQKN
ncbi:HAD hydrolase-like protein [Lentisphaerota bacterium ZTH]|nr:HAD hydrolase-like protein [Lentisphaerota bacterium]WET07366.1 HAD hydrolase-like protein [Lentisphaerota bacterium ZTH]